MRILWSNVAALALLEAPRLTELPQDRCVCAGTKPRASARGTGSQSRKSTKCRAVEALKYWFYGT